MLIVFRDPPKYMKDNWISHFYTLCAQVQVSAVGTVKLKLPLSIKLAGHIHGWAFYGPTLQPVVIRFLKWPHGPIFNSCEPCDML